MTFRVEIRHPHEPREPDWWTNSQTEDENFSSGMAGFPPISGLTTPVNLIPLPTFGIPQKSSTSEVPSTLHTSPAQETSGSAPSKSTGPSHPYESSPTTKSPSDLNSFLGGPTSKPEKNESSKHSSSKAHIGMAVGMVMVFAILGVILFLYLRRRRRQKRQTVVQQEMKSHNPAAYPPVAQQQAYYQPPLGPPSTLSPMPPQPPPVILGPITPNSNGAYYTGIDTSDVVSMHEPTAMHEPTGLGNPFIDPQHEEPPPPYRPRSLAPLSRDSSLRSPPQAALSQTNLIAAQAQSRSPFRDPHDDDNISEFSAGGHPYGRRAVDELSMVSDLSYQHDPVIERPAV